MYQPVPGHTHLKVLVPEPVVGPEPQSPSPSGSRLSPLVRIALDAAFGVRELRVLQQRTYSFGVRKHVAAQRRALHSPSTVRVLSCHGRDTPQGTELYGSIVSGGRTYGWVALIDGGRLTTFRIL